MISGDDFVPREAALDRERISVGLDFVLMQPEAVVYPTDPTSHLTSPCPARSSVERSGN
jgi:hypothetical protein